MAGNRRHNRCTFMTAIHCTLTYLSQPHVGANREIGRFLTENVLQFGSNEEYQPSRHPRIVQTDV
jgi:hypothetical protein